MSNIDARCFLSDINERSLKESEGYTMLISKYQAISELEKSVKKFHWAIGINNQKIEIDRKRLSELNSTSFFRKVLNIGNIKSVLENFMSLSFIGMKDGMLVLIFFALGAVIGLIGISKLIKFLLKKWPKTVYSAILGLLVSSPFSIIYVTIQDYQETIDWSSHWVYIVGVLMLTLGGALAVGMAIYDEKISNKKNEPNV